MPRLGPIRRRVLITYFRRLGFDGPYAGGRHEFMRRGDVRLILPNPHRRDIPVEFLVRLLREAEITREEWSGYDRCQGLSESGARGREQPVLHIRAPVDPRWGLDAACHQANGRIVERIACEERRLFPLLQITDRL